MIRHPRKNQTLYDFIDNKSNTWLMNVLFKCTKNVSAWENRTLNWDHRSLSNFFTNDDSK